jgi:ATP-dependent protease HslVU (ClpYQ) peptidase subunit
MTCIIALKQGNKIYMGGDRRSTCNGVTESLASPKIFKNNNFLIGVAGDLRMLQVMQYDFVPPDPDGTDPMRYMVSDFVHDLRITLKESGYTKVENNVEVSAGQMLVAYNKKIFKIVSNYSVSEEVDYVAIGSGTEAALGSLYTTSQEAELICDITPQRRIMLALQAAAKFDYYVDKPFDILEL